MARKSKKFKATQTRCPSDRELLEVADTIIEGLMASNRMYKDALRHMSNRMLSIHSDITEIFEEQDGAAELRSPKS